LPGATERGSARGGEERLEPAAVLEPSERVKNRLEPRWLRVGVLPLHGYARRSMRVPALLAAACLVLASAGSAHAVVIIKDGTRGKTSNFYSYECNAADTVSLAAPADSTRVFAESPIAGETLTAWSNDDFLEGAAPGDVESDRH
jgi:hypothetical protein